LGNQRRSLVKPMLFALSRNVVEVDVRSTRPAGSHLGIGDLVTFWLEFDVLHRRPPWAWLTSFGLLVILTGSTEVVLGLIRMADGHGWWLAAAGFATTVAGVQLIALGALAGLLLKGLQAQSMPWFRIVEFAGPVEPSSDDGGLGHEVDDANGITEVHHSCGDADDEHRRSRHDP
jgi:hypothetical protein